MKMSSACDTIVIDVIIIIIEVWKTPPWVSITHNNTGRENGRSIKKRKRRLTLGYSSLPFISLQSTVKLFSCHLLAVCVKIADLNDDILLFFPLNALFSNNEMTVHKNAASCEEVKRKTIIFYTISSFLRYFLLFFLFPCVNVGIFSFLDLFWWKCLRKVQILLEKDLKSQE